MLAPVGVLNITDKIIPMKKFNTEIMTDDIITDLKVLQTLIAVSAGNIIRAEISIEPIIFIPITITIADKRAINIL